MTRSTTPLLDAALAVAAGDPKKADLLYDRLQELTRRAIASFDDDTRSRAPGEVLLRWHGSLDRCLNRLRDHAGTVTPDMVRACSRRGASPEQIQGVLGRSLSDDEIAALDPFADDDAVLRYLAAALKNAARDAVRSARIARERERRAGQEPRPRPSTPDDGIAPDTFAKAADLLTREILPAFKDSHSQEWTWLQEIRSGRSAEEIARESLGADATEEDIRRRRRLVYQHWTRARSRLLRTVEERRGDHQFRAVIVPAVRILIDQEFRRKERPVRNPGGSRLSDGQDDED